MLKVFEPNSRGVSKHSESDMRVSLIKYGVNIMLRNYGMKLCEGMRAVVATDEETNRIYLIPRGGSEAGYLIQTDKSGKSAHFQSMDKELKKSLMRIMKDKRFVEGKLQRTFINSKPYFYIEVES